MRVGAVGCPKCSVVSQVWRIVGEVPRQQAASVAVQGALLGVGPPAVGTTGCVVAPAAGRQWNDWTGKREQSGAEGERVR